MREDLEEWRRVKSEQDDAYQQTLQADCDKVGISWYLCDLCVLSLILFTGYCASTKAGKCLYCNVVCSDCCLSFLIEVAGFA